jgi:hypothetical protein
MRPQSFFFCSRPRGNHGTSSVVNTREGMLQIEPGSHPDARGGGGREGGGAQSMRLRPFSFYFVFAGRSVGEDGTHARFLLLWAGHWRRQTGFVQPRYKLHLVAF